MIKVNIDPAIMQALKSKSMSIDELMFQMRNAYTDEYSAYLREQEEKRSQIKNALSVLINNEITAEDVVAVLNKYVMQRYPDVSMADLHEYITARDIDDIVDLAFGSDDKREELINKTFGDVAPGKAVTFKAVAPKEFDFTFVTPSSAPCDNTSKKRDGMSDDEFLQQFINKIM